MVPNPPADGDNPRLLHPHASRAVFLAAMLVLATASVALRGEATPDGRAPQRANCDQSKPTPGATAMLKERALGDSLAKG
jgi:hypothetical protein